jgi:hypothetical protein
LVPLTGHRNLAVRGPDEPQDMSAIAWDGEIGIDRSVALQSTLDYERDWRGF